MSVHTKNKLQILKLWLGQVGKICQNLTSKILFHWLEMLYRDVLGKKNNNSSSNNNNTKKTTLKTVQYNVLNERAVGMWLRKKVPWTICTWDDCLCVVGAVSEDVGSVVHKLQSWCMYVDIKHQGLMPVYRSLAQCLLRSDIPESHQICWVFQDNWTTKCIETV